MLDTTSSPPAARPPSDDRRSWEDGEIRKRWLGGESAKVIAAAVQISRNAVIGRARRMGLPGRESPIVRAGPPRERVPRLPGALRAHIDSAVPAVPFDRPPPAQHLPRAVRPDPYGSSLGCQFPMWAHGVGRGGPDYGRLCLAAREHGSAYCCDHRAVCVSRVQLLAHL